MDTDLILRPALGAIVKLGDLYNLRSNSFTGGSIFRRQVSNEEVGSVKQITTKEIEFINSDKFSKKLLGLNVHIRDYLLLNILGGTIPLEGSAKYYLEHEKCRARSVSCTLQYKITTDCERLVYEYASDEEVIDVLENTESTHFVFEILWGSNLFVTATYQNEDNQNKADVLKELETCFSFLDCTTQTKRGQRNLLESHVVADSKFHFASDILLEESYPNTATGARDLIDSYAEILTKTSQGRGQQLRFTLVPLSKLNDIYLKNFKTPAKFQFDRSFNYRVLSLFDDIQASTQLLNDTLAFHDSGDTAEPGFSFSHAELEEIKNLELKFRTDFRELLLKYQREEAHVADLEKVVEKYEQHDLAPSKVRYVLEENQFYKNANYRAAVYKKLCGHNVIFLSNQESYYGIYDSFRIDRDMYNDSANAYVLYTNFLWKADEGDCWRKTFEAFLLLIKESKSETNSNIARFFYVDTHLCGEIDSSGRTVIHQYKNGNSVSSDVYRNNRKIFGDKSKVLSIFLF